jgi:hypothetical protein
MSCAILPMTHADDDAAWLLRLTNLLCRLPEGGGR